MSMEHFEYHTVDPVEGVCLVCGEGHPPTPRPTAESLLATALGRNEAVRLMWGTDGAREIAADILRDPDLAAVFGDSAYARLVVDGSDIDRDRYMDDPVYHGIIERIHQAAALSDSARLREALEELIDAARPFEDAFEHGTVLSNRSRLKALVGALVGARALLAQPTKP